MTLAGLLAILAARQETPHPLFRAACAIVEPAEGNQLRCVERRSVGVKLSAFVREYEEGSLLVRPSDCSEADAFEGRFRHVWRVDSFAELAARAEEAGLLNPFRQQAPLSRLQFERALGRLGRMVEFEHRYRETLPLALRLLDHPRGDDTPVAVAEDVRQMVFDLQRHLGQYAEAVTSAEKHVKRLARQEKYTSYEEQARAACNLAAALYDAHCFHDARAALEEWDDRATNDPQFATPDTRIRVFNTIGRIEAIVGGSWEAYFRESLDLPRRIDPSGQARTLCYLIQSLLRHARLGEAENAIHRAESLSGLAEFSHRVLRFARADLARQQARLWSDDDLDRLRPHVGPAGHPLGFYFQATARQPGRTVQDRIARFNTAAAFFEVDVDPGSRRGLLSFLAECMRLRVAAESADADAWREAVAKLKSFFRGRVNQGFAEYYRTVSRQLGPTPAVSTTEDLLNRVPYF